MRAHATRTPSPPFRRVWHCVVIALLMLAGASSIVGLAAPTAALGSSTVVDQCNSHVPGAEGATTAMRCTVTVVNTVSDTSTSSTTTVTRLCTLAPCSTPNGTFTTRSPSLVTSVRQCNDSDNDAAHTIDCRVEVTNNISQKGAAPPPLSSATVNQCIGSGKGSPEGGDCTPFPATATATGAWVTQCNGSANGGGGRARCTVDPRSQVSTAIPVTVSQCNGTGNAGGSAVTCTVSLVSHVTKVVGTDTDDGNLVPATAPRATPSATPRATPLATPRATATQAPAIAAQTGAASSGDSQTGWYMLGAALVLAASVGALLFRRYSGKADRPQG